MTKSSKIIMAIALVLVLAVLTIYCAEFGKPTEESGVQTQTPEEESATDISEEDAMATAQILCESAESVYASGQAINIAISTGASRASASSVQIESNTVTITAPGFYQLSGTLENGQVYVDTDGQVVLILDGADITNSSDAAIKIANADHVLVYLPSGSENHLLSGTEQEIISAEEYSSLNSAEGAALYARDDLSFAGAGTLNIGGYINNGAATTNHLTVLCGTLNIEAVNNGLKGKDSVLVVDGILNITSGNDGIKSNNDTDANCGTVEIRNGTVNLTSFGDGIQAEQDLAVYGGTLNVIAGTVSGNEVSSDMMPEVNMPEEMDPATKSNADQPRSGASSSQTLSENSERTDDTQTERIGGRPTGGIGGDFADNFDREWGYSSDSDTSTKGLKSGGNLTIVDGSFVITSADDCIHADGSVTITGGNLSLASGDDGIHAGETLTLNGADIAVTESYEGLEAHNIYILDGDISVTASDDGLNANGGSSMFGTVFSGGGSDDTSMPTLQISGGTLYVNASGDGLDSNGDLVVDGGTIIVDGPSDNGNGALDSGTENGGSLACNGGTVLAIGGSGMAECFESESMQPSFIYNFDSSLPAGSEIVINDAEGNVIFTHTAAKAFNSVVFSSAELTIGTTVTLSAGNQITEISIDGITNGNSTGSGMGGGFGGKGRGPGA